MRHLLIDRVRWTHFTPKQINSRHWASGAAATPSRFPGPRVNLCSMDRYIILFTCCLCNINSLSDLHPTISIWKPTQLIFIQAFILVGRSCCWVFELQCGSLKSLHLDFTLYLWVKQPQRHYGKTTIWRSWETLFTFLFHCVFFFCLCKIEFCITSSSIKFSLHPYLTVKKTWHW